MKMNKKLTLSIVLVFIVIGCLISGIFLTINSTNTLIRKTKFVSEVDVPISSTETLTDDGDDTETDETDSVINTVDDVTSSEDNESDEYDEEPNVPEEEIDEPEEENEKPQEESSKPEQETEKPKEETEDSDENSEESKEEFGETEEETEEPEEESDETEEKGTIYYVSSSDGNDKNDGLSEDKPLKTIGKVNKLDLADGDKVLFKCGDLWRGEVLEGADAYVTYSSYGKGEKPTFYGSYENYAGESKWLPTKHKNVYVLYKKIGDVGTFFFNNNKLWAIKKTKTTPDKLKNDLEFCVDYDTKEVFLYSAKGNPGKIYSSIEATVSLRLINLKTGNTVENLKLMYANYGVQCWTGSDITVRNMDIHWMGGCGNEIRAGNAIEFWSNLENIVIENNVISHCYDTGITCQYTGYEGETKDIIMSDIYVRNNKISNCFWSTEFWIDMKSSAVGHIRNLQITDNVFKDAGDCWSYDQRSMPNTTLFPFHIHLQAYNNYGDREVTIMNNVISGGKGGIIYGGRDANFLPKLEGNTYVMKKGDFFGVLRAKSFTFDDSLSVILKTIIDKKAIVKYAD